jgi:hypothetical protein
VLETVEKDHGRIETRRGGVPDVEIHYSCSSQAHVLTR